MPVDSGSYSPPAGVAVSAKRALAWIAEGKAGSGFTAVGRARASQLASGRDVSSDVVNRMISYFARHQVDKQAEGFKSGEDGFPSAGRVAWDAWGGDAGQSWVNGLNSRSVTSDVDKIINVSNTESEARMSDEEQSYPLSREELQAKIVDLKSSVLDLIGDLVEAVDDLTHLVNDSESVSPEVPAVTEIDTLEEDAVRFVEPEKVAELALRGERVDKGIERRQALQDLEIRAEGNGMTLRGYAAVFDSPSQPLPFIETIQQGAFRDSLKSRNDIKLLWNHDTSVVLGSTRAGTLRLVEDSRGLLLEADLPDTQAGRDAVVSIQRGDVTGFSFGFRVPVGGDVWTDATQRVLKRVNVHEVSVGVAFPAYTGTDGTANVRSLSDLNSKIVSLAEMRGVSAEELTDALLALESGDELTERQGELLTDTLGKLLKKDPEVTNPQAVLDLKKKKLDLLMNKV